MYKYGIVCYRMNDLDCALKTFVSIIVQPINDAKVTNGAYVNIIQICNTQLSDLKYKISNNTDAGVTDALEQSKCDKMSECEKYLSSWIETDMYQKLGYFMFLEYLWRNGLKKRMKLLWNEWINKFENMSNGFEGAEEGKYNEQSLSDARVKVQCLLSDLYQKYARILTQNKIVSKVSHKSEEKMPTMVPRQNSLEDGIDDCNTEYENISAKRWN